MTALFFALSQYTELCFERRILMEDFEVGQGVKRYIQWPLFLSVCWIPVILLLNSFSGRKAAGIAVLGFILYSALAVVVYILEKRRMVN